MKANLEDIAKASGVSKMTVSRVLRGGTGFSDETRDRVLKVAERLGYVPNKLAAAFGADQSVEEEEAWVRQLVSWRPAGVILSGRTHTPATVDLLRKAALPVVEIWDLTTSPIDMAVGFSHFDCGVEMGRHLIRRGRRRAGYVGALARADVMGAARLDGFRSELAQAGHPLVDAEVLHDAPGFYAGYYGMETLLSRRGDLDAVYFHNDEMAIGGLAFCQARGLRVPDDIGVAGWGGMEAASILPRRLTTTVVPTTAIGKAAAEALAARLAGVAGPDVTIVPTRLVPGETV